MIYVEIINQKYPVIFFKIGELNKIEVSVLLHFIRIYLLELEY